jgi:hypothetical protein
MINNKENEMSNNLELFEKINVLVEKAPENRHSYYQLKHFIIGKQPTTQSQLWQCLTELQSRKETIDNLTMQVEDLRDDLLLLQIKESKVKVVYSEDEQEKEIKQRKRERKRESIVKTINKLEKQLEFVVQEARFFVQAFEAIEEVEKLKDFDDYDAQKELWEAKVSEEINLRLLFHQPLSPDTLKTALSLHDESRVKKEVLKMIEVVEKANIKMLGTKKKGE